MASLEQVILDCLACSLNFRLGGNFSYAYTPPVLVTCGHGLRQNLHVDQGGNSLLLGILDCSLQLIKSLNGVGLAAVSSADCSVIYLDYLALVDTPLVTPSSSMFFSVQMEALPLETSRLLMQPKEALSNSITLILWPI